MSRRRFALALLLITQIASNTASAQAIPGAEDKETLRIYLEALTADLSCPGVRINQAQLAAYMSSRGFAERNIRDKYPEFFDEAFSIMSQGIKDDRASHCRFFFDDLGDLGVHPHILVRRQPGESR